MKLNFGAHFAAFACPATCKTRKQVVSLSILVLMKLHSMMEERSPKFPVGSVIVKEKLPAKDSSTVELMTAMVKHESGYNPKNGDWEFLVLDGSGKIETRGKLESCQACHLMEKATDYVSRSYLPANVREKLR